MTDQNGYTLYLIDQDGKPITTAPYLTRAEARTEYNKCARIFRSRGFAPEVKEVALYIGADIELIASTAFEQEK